MGGAWSHLDFFFKSSMCSVHDSDGFPKKSLDGGCVIIRSRVVIRGRGRFLVIRHLVRPEHVYISCSTTDWSAILV